MLSSFRTVASWFRHEPDKIKGSRHIATVVPVRDEASIAAALGEVRAEFPAAGHHAYAWRLGVDARRFHYSDDGEPSGCAGSPILKQVDRLELTRVLVVVSRVFGGTKLGTGGLVRAYGGAARAALDGADVVECVLTAEVSVEHDYEHAGAVQAVQHAAGLVPRTADYGSRTRLVYDVPIDRARIFEVAIRDATAGCAEIELVWPEED